MTLPPLSIPNIPLPFDIPQTIHPLVVHFAIALPILVLLLELINLFAKKRTIGVLSFFFMVLIAGVFFIAYLTGVTDGKSAKEFLSPEAKVLLGEHKQLGVYLVYASGILMLFKLFSVIIRKAVIRILFFVVLIAFTVAVFNEGKKGGALVYEYGVNVKSVPAIGKQVGTTGKDTKSLAVAITTENATKEKSVMESNSTTLSEETTIEKVPPVEKITEQPLEDTNISTVEGNIISPIAELSK